jgi:hypothetical protein
MTATTTQTGAGWHVLLQPRWLLWHALVWLASAGMLILGDWQLHRAEAGNELSWAYTFEWPLFTAFTLYFWVKSLRDELRRDGAAVAGPAEAGSHDGADLDGAWDSAAPADGHPARLTPADGEAYVAWLKAEVQQRSRWNRWLR